MTIGEIKIIIENFQEKQETEAKELLATNYNLAVLVSTFVMNGLNGKSNPSMAELFPDYFCDEEYEQKQKEKESKAWMLYREQMLDFATAHNKKRHAKEGEDLRDDS